MPSALRVHQHELMAENGARSFVWGTEDTGYLTLTKPAVSVAEPREGDVDRPGEDGRGFGQDLRGAKAFTFEVGVITDRLNGLDGGDPYAANVDHLDSLEAAWQDEWWRERPDRFAVLRSNEAGRIRRCYGRPRSYEEADGAFTAKGYTPVVAEFALIDGRWYDDTEQQVTCPLAPTTVGGLVAPLVAPLASTGESEGETFAQIGGSRSTWPIVEFDAPYGVTNPSVTIGGLTIGLRGTIPVGSVVTVDPRPWKRTVVRQDGANYAGWLTYDTPPLKKMLAAPGKQPVVYRGTDNTASSVARVRWRDARNRP